MVLSFLVKGFRILSPTYVVADIRKKAADKEGGAEKRAERIIAYNHRYLFFSILLFCAFGVTDKWQMYPYSDYKKLYYFILCLYIWMMPLSRCNEIFYAFISDALDKFCISNKSKSALNYQQRLRLAFLSYLELIINFATIYYILPSCFWKKDAAFGNIIDALYFSGVTITTVGYGDYTPIHWFPKLLTVYEVFCGVILLVVCFTVYTSLGLSDREKRGPTLS
jgi:voltage-gated potassium channel